MQIAFLIYEGLTALDIVGPYEVLCRVPDADVRFVAKRAGEVSVDTGAFSIRAPHGLADVPRPDVFVIPGGLAGTAIDCAEVHPQVVGARTELYSTYGPGIGDVDIVL